jgi:hypothetical protein
MLVENLPIIPSQEPLKPWKKLKMVFHILGADIDAIHTSKMLNIREENVVSFNKIDMVEMMNEISYGDTIRIVNLKGKIKKSF